MKNILKSQILSLNFEVEASESSKDVIYKVQLGIFDELIDVEGNENHYLYSNTTSHTLLEYLIILIQLDVTYWK